MGYEAPTQGQEKRGIADMASFLGRRLGGGRLDGHRPRHAADRRGSLVNVLLLSMPDSFEHMPSLAIRLPNGALTSLAGNVDPHHRVAVADLLLVQNRVRETVERLLATGKPDLVGLSVMTFQRRTAKK